MSNWLKYKNQLPWSKGKTSNKEHYNEGNIIASKGYPVWNIPNQDVNTSPITPTHNPCGYWPKTEISNKYLIITGTFPITMNRTNYRRYAGCEIVPGAECVTQDGLYLTLQGIPPTLWTGGDSYTYLYHEYNKFTHYSGDDIRLYRSSREWDWYADPTLAIDFRSVVGFGYRLYEYSKVSSSNYCTWLAHINGMGFEDYEYLMYDTISTGASIYINRIYIENYNFHCVEGQTYTVTHRPFDYDLVFNPHNCAGYGSSYSMSYGIVIELPYLILGRWVKY
jgi:hypothetical protein